MAPTARGLATLLLLPAAVAAACAGPELAGSPESDRLAARRGLVGAAARGGPVPLVVAGDPAPLDPAALPGLAAKGVTGLSPAFALAAAPATEGERLVLWFGAPPGATAGAACAGAGSDDAAPPRSVPTSPPELLAAWCDELHPLAAVRGAAADAGGTAAERLVWQATGRLFPDDYAETYGFDLFGWRVRLGGNASF